MNLKQEPKYVINGEIRNRQSNEAIPDDEPIFILRGRDAHAVETLAEYWNIVNKNGGQSEHLEAINKRIVQFQQFAKDYPTRMKKPDTVLTPDWDNL